MFPFSQLIDQHALKQTSVRFIKILFNELSSPYCIARKKEEIASILGYEPGHEKMCLMSYANNKGADQTAHPPLLFPD